MHLVTLSKYQLQDATRHQLPLLRESRVRQLFNLRRCVLETPLTNGPTLFNTHLSAFSYGDGTVERQVARLRELVGGKEFLLAGDLNSLTPYENAASLAKDEAALYPESNTPAAPLYDDAGIVPLWRGAAWKSRHRAASRRWRTTFGFYIYLPSRRWRFASTASGGLRRDATRERHNKKYTGGTPPRAARPTSPGRRRRRTARSTTRSARPARPSRAVELKRRTAT